MDKEKIFAIGMLVLITCVFIGVIIHMNNTINNLSEDDIKNFDPLGALKALVCLIGFVIICAFIYSFWWYPKKCIEYENKILKENKEHMDKMENL